MTALERITEWAELADKATEGPWFVESDEDEGTRVSFLHQRNGLVLLGSVASEWQELFLEDAAHIAASRTAVPAMAAALAAVLELHQPQERCHNGEGSWSVTRDVWDADYDGDPEVFLVCGHCGAIEMHESTEAGSDHTYLDSLWPCPTVEAVETALGVTP